MNAPARFNSSYSSSACDRVLAAIRWYFRQWSRSPSYGDIQAHSGVHKGRLGRYLNRLQAEGFLTHMPGDDRSIVMVDRFANASDEELIAACRGRNLVVSFPPLIAIPLGVAFPLDPRPVDPTEIGTHCPLAVMEELNHIPGVQIGERVSGQDENQADDAGEDCGEA